MTTPLKSTKDRIVAVDILRFLAAFYVMFEHFDLVRVSGYMEMFLGYLELLLPRVSPVFFVLAGFFACRNITWGKALNNAWWCFAPFVLWNIIAIGVAWWLQPDSLVGRDVISLFGFPGLFEGGGDACLPLNVPLWFMRDLVFLFLLSPILSKLARYILPVLVVLSLIPQTSYLLQFESAQVLSLNTIAFFSIGCILQGLGRESKRKCLEYCSPVFICGYLVVVTGVYLWDMIPDGRLDVPRNTFFQNVLSLFFICQLARWLDLHSPIVRKIGVMMAPVTFLTFAVHGIIYSLFPRDSSMFLLLPVPFVCLALCAGLFFFMKRWCRPLLHLVAHYKLRVEDVR